MSSPNRDSSAQPAVEVVTGDMESCTCSDLNAVTEPSDFEERSKSEISVRNSYTSSAARITRHIVKILGTSVIAVFFILAIIQSTCEWPATIVDNDEAKAVVMITLFLAGLIMVIVEDHVNVNKAAVMLIVSATMWTFLAVGYHPNSSKEGHEQLDKELAHGLHDVGSIILFLLPAMGLVESIDHFDGFAIVTHVVQGLIGDRTDLLMPVLCLLTFFMSAIIDNLTATIVAIKILQNVCGHDRHLRHTIGGVIVMAANAGGAWSPVGDVTTTMLWIQNKISVTNTVTWLFIPSFVTGVAPMVGLWWRARAEASARKPTKSLTDEDPALQPIDNTSTLPKVTRAKIVVLVLGFICIFMVPVLKMATGLPPYLGMLLALGVLWFVTDTNTFKHLMHLDDPRKSLQTDPETPHTPAKTQYLFSDEGVIEALHKMDLTGLLFFAGVLLAVGALNTAGVLNSYADLLISICNNSTVSIATLLGVSSAVVDNVPLVEAAIHMFEVPMDDHLWQLIALAAGTGGSILSVGSIAGVTFMTMEGVGYIWYCRRISLWAILGFTLGIVTFQLERMILV